MEFFFEDRQVLTCQKQRKKKVYKSSSRCAISDQKWCANWCAGDDVMRRDQPTRHDDLCVSKKAKYFRSFRDYVVQ